MFGSKTKKPKERFYLLPGQGGKNFHRKQQKIMRWTVAVSLVFALVLGTVMWWLARPKL